MTYRSAIRRGADVIALTAIGTATAATAAPPKMGTGGTIIDGSRPLETCHAALKSVSVVE